MRAGARFAMVEATNTGRAFFEADIYYSLKISGWHFDKLRCRVRRKIGGGLPFTASRRFSSGHEESNDYAIFSVAT
jgi:hypothetical protein